MNEPMNFENAIKPVSEMFDEGRRSTLFVLLCYIVLEFLSVYFLIESLRSALLSFMAQAIITSVFIFEELFYKAF